MMGMTESSDLSIVQDSLHQVTQSTARAEALISHASRSLMRLDEMTQAIDKLEQEVKDLKAAKVASTVEKVYGAVSTTAQGAYAARREAEVLRTEISDTWGRTAGEISKLRHQVRKLTEVMSGVMKQAKMADSRLSESVDASRRSAEQTGRTASAVETMMEKMTDLSERVSELQDTQLRMSRRMAAMEQQ